MKIKKSKQKIKESFLNLRKTRNIEKITVTELCQKAHINKSTFYVYYHDIYDLSECLEDEIVNEIILSITHPENIFLDPTSFTKEFIEAFFKKEADIKLIFSGHRSSILPDKIHKLLKEYLFTLMPEKQTERMNILLTYMIYGTYYSYMANEHYSRTSIDQEVSQIIKKLST